LIVTRNLSPFLFNTSIEESFFLVNADRVKRKLSSLLLDNNTNSSNGWKTFMRYRYPFEQFKRRNPEKFNSLTNRVLADLEFEKAVNATDKKAM
jgi:hypothetical protein